MPRGTGRGRGAPVKEGFGITIQGADDILAFLDDFPELVDSWMERRVEIVARGMTGLDGTLAQRISVKKGNWMPVDTGRLRAVFGAVDGKPNTRQEGFKGAEARLKSPKPLEADVIWEKYGRFTRVMGTDLYYAANTIYNADWLGVWLRGMESEFHKHMQTTFNTFMRDISRKYAFSFH